MDQNESPAAQDDTTGPVQITGSFEYTNDFVVETYYVEHAVALLDMTGFVKRDKEWELPVEGQVLGYMDPGRGKQPRLLRPVFTHPTPG